MRHLQIFTFEDKNGTVMFGDTRLGLSFAQVTGYHFGKAYRRSKHLFYICFFLVL